MESKNFGTSSSDSNSVSQVTDQTYNNVGKGLTKPAS